jgi:hypothetical protein
VLSAFAIPLSARVEASAGDGPSEDPRDQSRVPEVAEFSTPDLRPGEAGGLAFVLRNRYDARIVNVSLGIEIYRHVTTTGSSNVAPGSPDSPLLCPVGRPAECALALGLGHDSLAGRADQGGSRLDVELEVRTRSGTPHGGAFDPSTYLVRILVDFDYDGSAADNTTATAPYRLVSRGHIADAVWDEATRAGGLDIGLISAAHAPVGRPIIGIATETSFIVREPAPAWPAVAAGALVAVLLLAGGMMYLKETRSTGRGRRSKQTLDERPREPRQRRRMSKQR